MFDFSLAGLFPFVRAVIIVADVVLAVLFVYACLKVREYRPRFIRNPRAVRRSSLLDDPTVRERWLRILESVHERPPQSYALAIVEADKFADLMLQRLGYSGEHVADRLERLQGAGLASLDDLWRAHRLRNEVVHTPDFEVSEHNVRYALAAYERFFRELGAIE